MRPFAASFRVPCCLALLIALLTAGVARADDFALDPDQIKAALHTTTVEEEGFIDRTVGMVQDGNLPRDLFTSCFIWARKKPHHRFQYFKNALTIRAAEIGINLQAKGNLIGPSTGPLGPVAAAKPSGSATPAP